MSSEVSSLVPTGAMNKTKHKICSVVCKVTNLLDEGLGEVDDELGEVDDGLGEMPDINEICVRLLQYGVLQHNWYWSGDDMLLHEIPVMVKQSCTQ